ncbi:Oxygen-independent coproporphyrinogen-III oxidase [Oxalobacter formigenes]|uniref:Radical SAM domain protein n=2 Tax=Oxalobacter formigenes TaxID=847 RepID=C3XBG0_OXAFO|nr:Oxygen-independent coproporphyrinogen-III oxidase [Oxalobacter formigenes]EEO30536.1 radical SAM domain protein [Oxalobacter formigenes OXCC13]
MIGAHTLQNNKNAMSILLSTLNARYAHTALGLRYLKANMGALQSRTELMEFVIGADVTVLAEKILSRKPRILGLSVYIWNVEETTKLVSLIKAVSPDTIIILGGPEVSHETEDQPVARMADYVIRGWGEMTLPTLCRQILDGKAPSTKVHQGIQPAMTDITLPYDLYTDEDIAHRTLYVEASRGCPFRCEFCLSSLDKTAWAFDTDLFLDEMEKLYRRGARNFKFVDRTFNLNIKRSLQIIRFFLKKLEDAPMDPVFAHFELVPDHLPDALKEAILKFPEGSLQLEIGVQSFNTDVQNLISRKQDNEKSEKNIRWLREHTHAHMHADLIVGLPGENIDSFAKGFNRLVDIDPHEIQVGILKRLRGTPVLRHIEAYRLVFDSSAPYTILSTADIGFQDMQRMKRFARFWDLIANSGRFIKTLPFILKDQPFERFMALSDWIYRKTNAMHGIALERLASLITEWLSENGEELATARAIVGADFIPRAERGKKGEDNKHPANMALIRQNRRKNSE